MDLDLARSVALALPEVREQPHFEMTSFRVASRIFATAPPSADRLHVFLGEGEARTYAVAEDSAEELWWGRRLAGVRLDLAAASLELVTELLEEAWRRKAPPRLVADFDAASRRST